MIHEDSAAWAKQLEPIFGAHRLEADGSVAGARAISANVRGPLRFWEVRHGSQTVVVEGSAEFRHILRTTSRKDPIAFQQALRSGSFLLLMVSRGTAEIALGGDIEHLAADDAIVFTAIDPFRIKTSAAFVGTWVNLPIWWLLELGGGQVAGSRTKLDGARGAMQALRQIWAILLEPAVEGDDVDDLVALLGNALFRALLHASALNKRAEGLSDRVTRFIGSHYEQEGLAPADAARALGCSVSSIHKACAANSTSFGQRVAALRLSKAAYQLSRDPPSISTVAFQCGFSSLSHFCHAFKDFYGVTPSDVRKRYFRVVDRLPPPQTA